MTSGDPRDPDTLRRRAGVSGDPDRDQHFLVDDRVLDRIPGYLPVDADREHVLEIGGGTGALTDRLLAVAERVTVVERDPPLAEFLRTEFAADRQAGRLTVIEGDATEIDLPAFTASVSNLPYGVASQLLFRLLPARRPLVAMVQREFADRLVAAPGSPDYGRLSVTAGHYATVEIVEPVPATAFDPQPAVDSALVRARPTATGEAAYPHTVFRDLVTAVFTQRRKTMRNAIRNTTHISGIADPDAVVAAADVALMDRRPGEVTPTEFGTLATLIAERGGHG